MSAVQGAFLAHHIVDVNNMVKPHKRGLMQQLFPSLAGELTKRSTICW
jgi:hypothetical protein